MKANLWMIILCLFFTNCGKRIYYTADVENPSLKPNVAFHASEDLSSPKFAHLVEKYHLDTVFHGETDEFKRILLLRHWIKSVIAINDFGDPYPGDGYAEGILDAALKGQGFHCGHYMVVQNAIMNAFGYVTRTLGAGPGVKGGPDGHHGVNEVWLNKYNKWFLCDAKYDHHFEKNGIPLSALEIREEFLKNKGADIIKVKGPDRTPFDIDTETKLSKEQNAQTYTWIEWHGYNNRFTDWPQYTELLLMYDDDYSKNHTWIWDGKPHWAYAKPEFMKLISEKDMIYWTPNTIKSSVQITDHVAHIGLTSDTPNFSEYRMKKLPSDNWAVVDSIFDLKLEEKKYDLVFRAVNLAGVSGPEHKIIIGSK